MKTLVYVGANNGGSLSGLHHNFDVVYAFEPIPEVFEELNRRLGDFEHIHLINAACGTKPGRKDFYITPNIVSSSLSDIAEGMGIRSNRKIKVDVINLYDFLKNKNVDFIDLYCSDCQGSDLDILNTIKPYVDDIRIGELFIETHRDGIFLYEGLDNQLAKFKEILSVNYEYVYASCDGTVVSPGNIPSDVLEWDCYWRVK